MPGRGNGGCSSDSMSRLDRGIRTCTQQAPGRAPDMLHVIATSFIRLVASFLLFKVLASMFGPAALGFMTQVMGVVAIFYMFAGGGTTNGLVRNIARSSKEERRAWLGNGIAVHIGASVLLALVAVALAVQGGGSVLGDDRYVLVFLVVAVAQVLVGFGNIIVAYASGTGDVRFFAFVQIVSTLLGIGTVIIMATVFGFAAAVYALASYQAALGVVALAAFARRTGDFCALWPAWNWDRVRVLLGYTAVTIASVVAVPVAQILVRQHMSAELGWQTVGYWQAVAKISDAYMQVLGVVVIHVLLPRLTPLPTLTAQFRLVGRIGSVLVAMFLAGAVFFLAAKDVVITLAYSRDFLPAGAFVLPTLVADFLRIMTYLLLYVFVARGHVAILAVLGVFQGVAIYLLYLVLFPSVGAMAAVYNSIGAAAVMLVAMLVLSVYSGTRRG